MNPTLSILVAAIGGFLIGRAFGSAVLPAAPAEPGATDAALAQAADAVLDAFDDWPHVPSTLRRRALDALLVARGRAR